ncbi:MAG: DUF6647 family protein, partial [Pseudomonadota bacterium]
LQVEFADLHGFRLLEERRSSQQHPRFERRRYGLPMLVLGASIAGISQPELCHAHGDHAHADVDFGAKDMQTVESDEQIVYQLLAWISAQDISVSTLLQSPKVERSTPRQMLRMAFGEDMPASMKASELKVFGLYNFKNETVYLLNEIQLDTIRGRAVLVHELVHYAQYRDGENNRVRCVNELETLAYELEAKYLAEYGVQPDFDHHDVEQLSTCRA